MVHLLCAEQQYLFQQVLHFPLPALAGAAQFLFLALCQLRQGRGLVLFVLLFQLLAQLLALLSTRWEIQPLVFISYAEVTKTSVFGSYPFFTPDEICRNISINLCCRKSAIFPPLRQVWGRQLLIQSSDWRMCHVVLTANNFGCHLHLAIHWDINDWPEQQATLTMQK